MADLYRQFREMMRAQNSLSQAAAVMRKQMQALAARNQTNTKD